MPKKKPSTPPADPPAEEPAGSLIRPTRSSRAALLALAQAEAAFGGRPEVANQLAEHPDPRANALVRLLVDPGRQKDSLVSLAADVGMAPSTLLNLLRDGAFSRAIAQSQIHMAERLPEVVVRVADSALGYHAPCRCTNGGLRAAEEGCPICKGLGQEWTKPSLAHQTLLMEATELLKRGGPMVQVGLAVGSGGSVGGGPAVFDQMVKGLAGAARRTSLQSTELSSARSAPDWAADSARSAVTESARDFTPNPPDPSDPSDVDPLVPIDAELVDGASHA